MAEAGRPWWRRWRRLAVAAIAVQAAYVGSYAALYARGVREADAFGSKYVFYVPAADVVEARRLPPQHVAMMAVYDPLNELHVRWLGGRSACRGITFGLSR